MYIMTVKTFASISIPIKDNHAFVVSWGFCRPRGVVPAVVVSADLKEWFVPLCFLVTQRSGSKYTHFGFREWRLWFLNLLLSKTMQIKTNRNSYFAPRTNVLVKDLSLSCCSLMSCFVVNSGVYSSDTLQRSSWIIWMLCCSSREEAVQTIRAYLGRF
jgi:hypothetical protein